jgi:hypothetical protein
VIAVSGAFKREMTSDRGRDAVAYAVAIIFGAAFPRLWFPRRWRTPLSTRGIIGYIAFKTVIGFVLQVCVLPYLRRMAQERAQAEEELRQTLGREPTDDELLAHLGVGRVAPATGT